MNLWVALCAVLCFCVCGIDGSLIRCGDDSECPTDHCCLAVGEELICSPLRTRGQLCQAEPSQPTRGENDVHLDTPLTHVDYCPCSTELFCDTKDQDSSSSSESAEQPVCKLHQPKSSSSSESNE